MKSKVGSVLLKGEGGEKREKSKRRNWRRGEQRSEVRLQMSC